jgi:hypothetical protein
LQLHLMSPAAGAYWQLHCSTYQIGRVRKKSDSDRVGKLGMCVIVASTLERPAALSSVRRVAALVRRGAVTVIVGLPGEAQSSWPLGVNAKA